MELLVVVAAVGAGVAAGVFFAFSTFVMPALRKVPDAVGLTAMQSINRAAPNPLFMLVLLGTGVLVAGLAVGALIDLDEPGAGYVLGGAVAYLVSIALTGGYHVPRNNALDKIDPDALDAPAAWARFYVEWTRMNHVRTLACTVAAVLLTLAVRAG